MPQPSIFSINYPHNAIYAIISKTQQVELERDFMDFTEVISQIAILFIIMFVGYYLRRVGIINEEGVKNFSSLIFYVAMPGLIVASLSETSLSSASDLGQLVLASLISYTLFILVALIVPKLLKVKDGSKGLFRYMTIFANVGFIGFPMLRAIIGDSSVFLGAVLIIPFNFLLFTLGVYFITSDKGHGHKVKLSIWNFLNPGIIATLFGLIVMFMGLQLPTFVMGTAKTLGAITTPVAMMVVGASLVGVKIKQMLKNYRVLLLSVIRMVIFPLIIGLILKVIGLDTMTIAVAMVLSGMPIGTTTVILARQYGGDVLDASEAVFISTIMLLLTAPLLVLMIQWIA